MDFVLCNFADHLHAQTTILHTKGKVQLKMKVICFRLHWSTHAFDLLQRTSSLAEFVHHWMALGVCLFLHASGKDILEIGHYSLRMCLTNSILP